MNELISFPVDRKYEMIIENDNNFDNRCMYTTVVS